jgi:hypothetical protein
MEQTAQYDHIDSTDEADAERAPMPRVDYIPWYWSDPNTGTGDPQPARSDARIEALVHGLPPMEELWARLPARDAVALLHTETRCWVSPPCRGGVSASSTRSFVRSTSPPSSGAMRRHGERRTSKPRSMRARRTRGCGSTKP